MNAGRPWEVVVAGRQLPQLARLRGFGFVVNIEAVRGADLRAVANNGPLGGVALRSCIEGEGDPPRELLLAAVACAASGTVHGFPMEELREDKCCQLKHNGPIISGTCLGVIGAELLAFMLPVATSLRSLRCRSDNASLLL